MVLNEIFNKIRSLSPFKKHLGTMPLSVTRIYSGLKPLFCNIYTRDSERRNSNQHGDSICRNLNLAFVRSSTLGLRAKKLKPTLRFFKQESRQSKQTACRIRAKEMSHITDDELPVVDSSAQDSSFGANVSLALVLPWRGAIYC